MKLAYLLGGECARQAGRWAKKRADRHGQQTKKQEEDNRKVDCAN